MRTMKTVIVCTILMLLSVFVIACGGQNEHSEPSIGYQSLQDEIARLQRNFDNLMNEHNSLQDEFNLIQDQLVANDFERLPVNGKQQDEINYIVYEFQNLLAEHYLLQAEVVQLREQLVLAQFSASPSGWEYMVRRFDSRFNIQEILQQFQNQLNTYAQQGWQFVSKHSDVTIMRRQW